MLVDSCGLGLSGLKDIGYSPLVGPFLLDCDKDGKLSCERSFGCGQLFGRSQLLHIMPGLNCGFAQGRFC